MIARVLGNAELILDKRLKNKPTLTSYGYRLVGKSSALDNFSRTTDIYQRFLDYSWQKEKQENTKEKQTRELLDENESSFH